MPVINYKGAKATHVQLSDDSSATKAMSAIAEFAAFAEQV